MFALFHSLQLVTERLSISPFQECDLAAVYDMHRNADVNKYIPYSTWLNWHDAEQWLSMMHQRRIDKEAQIFSLKRKEDGVLIGTSLVFGANKTVNDLNVGYVLSQSEWGKGYASEAMRGLSESLLLIDGIPQLNATVQDGNIASMKVLTKLGFSEVHQDVEADGTRIRCFKKTAM